MTQRFAWRDAEGIFANPRNGGWRRRRDEVKAAQEAPTGAFELAQHPEVLDWDWVSPSS